MSLYGKLEADVEIKAPASKFHELIHKRPHHLSKASGKNIQSCELHEGDWGQVGSITYFNYFHDGKAKVEKAVIEAVDEEKNLITFKSIDGDLLKDYKTYKYTLQAIPKDNGSLIHLTLEYEKLHENVKDAHSFLEFCISVAKDIDTHLMKAN